MDKILTQEVTVVAAVAEAAALEVVAEYQKDNIQLSKKFKPIIIRGSGGGKGGGGGSSYAADDNLFARQSATFIDAIAEGPIKGLVHGDASILLMKQDLEMLI